MNTFYFRRPIIINNHQMKRRYRYLITGRLSLQGMMINDDHKHSIELMQSQSSSTSVNQTQSSNFTVYDNNQHLHLTEQKKSISSSTQIRLGIRCLCPLDEKQEEFFDDIFSINEQISNISECIFNQYITRLTTNSINTFIILSGQYREISQIQNSLISLTLIYLHNFVIKQNKSCFLRITVQKFESPTNQGKTIILPSDHSSVTCPYQTSTYLHNLCCKHQSYPLLITFHLINRSTNIQFHLLSTNETTNQDEYSNILMSLSLSLPSTRQKQSFHLSNKRRNSHEQYSYSLASIFHEYVINIDKQFLYILATINNDKQLKSWTKIQRLIKTKRNRYKMSSIDSKDEIWVDGPLSKPEIWIDGPRSSSKIRLQKSSRSKPMHTKAKLPFRSSPHNNLDDPNFDTESIVSSHCHLPVLPVFKDHTLLPFRSNQQQQTLPKPKPAPMNLKLSTNKLNDDLEILEKTLETLLVPSSVVNPNNNTNEMTQSLNRMEQISSLMTNDEKTKRLSRIVSPTRFEKLFSTEKQLPSVPNSPYLLPKARYNRTKNHSIDSNKKPKIPLRTTSLAETNNRPSIFQRLFGIRPTINSPPLSPLTVTLDSHDDLMPLTTSSTASSGRASSSGYESMSNTILDDIMNLNGKNSIKLRNKSTIRKEERKFNSPMGKEKFSQLKHRQNELKLELAMTKTFLLMDKNKTFEHNDSVNSTIPNSPMHMIIPNSYEEEMDELEKDIEHLERRLASAQSQLILINSQKNKPAKS